MSVACYPTDIQSPLDPGGIQEPVPAPTVSKSLLLGMFTAWTTCIHLICSWCSACFFSQHLLPGHLARYPKSFLLKSQPLLPIWAINAIQGPRSHWGQYLPPCSYLSQKWGPRHIRNKSFTPSPSGEEEVTQSSVRSSINF